MGITKTTADNAVKSKISDTVKTENIINDKIGTTGLRHARESLICLNVDPKANIGNEIRLKRKPIKTPHAIAIKEFVLSIKAWPIAKATKKGDHVAEVFIPRRQASAIALR